MRNHANNTISSPRQESGFTLIEIAIVLVIVGLLLGGLLMPLATQVEQQRIKETQSALEEIREALIGFAVANGRFPCPTTQTNPASAGYGQETTPCNANAAAEGYLPWRTLGVSEIDAWGILRGTTAAPWIGYWRYRVDRNFSNSLSLITVGTGFSVDSLTIQNSSGAAITATTERPVAIVYSTGKDTQANGANGSYEATSATYQSDVISPTFDDHLIFISRPLLYSRLAQAGRL